MEVKLGTGAYRELFQKDWDYCRTHFQVLELQDFIMPDNLENPVIVSEYREMLDGFPGEITLHGPYLNLVPTSLDRRVKELAELRYLQSVEIAAQLGADKVIIHSYYDVRPGYQDYERDWLADNAEFWSRFMEQINGSGLNILLENCYDRQPVSFAGLISEVNHPLFGTCLDIGHCHCFSSSPPEAWIAASKSFYYHISDNDGHDDYHLLMGRGSINSDGVARELAKHPRVCLVSEARASFGDQYDSLKRLRDLIEGH